MLNIRIFEIKQNPFFIKNLNIQTKNSEKHNIKNLIIQTNNSEKHKNLKIPYIDNKIQVENNISNNYELNNFEKISLNDIDYEFLESISKKKRKKKFNYKLNKTQPLYENKELKEKKNLISPQLEKPEQKTLINPNINLRNIYTPRIKNDDCKIF